MKVKLKTLSPLHIGGKERIIYPSEYVILNGRCYVINEERLSKKLYELGKLNMFLDDLKQLGKRFKIEMFLKGKNLLREDFLEDVSSYSSECRVRVYPELRPFIRNAFSQAYIPGSSIKGVLRTSIMYVILKTLNDSVRRRVLDNFVRGRLEKYNSDLRGRRGYTSFQERFKKWFAQPLDKDIFQKFTLKSSQRRYDAHSDISRCLKVSDSVSINKDSLAVNEIKIYSARSNESPKRWSIFAECVPPNRSFEFGLTVDQGILNDFVKMNRQTRFGMSFADLSDILSDPLRAAQEMSADLFQKEQEFFSQELHLKSPMEFKEEKPNFRLGWGEGLLGTSMAMLLPVRLRQDLRNTLFKDCGSTPAPKSRRVAMANGEIKTLGWCTVETEVK